MTELDMNRPYSRYPPSLHALRTDGIEVMSRGFSGGKHVINFSNTRNRGRICFFSTTENEQLFTLKTIWQIMGGSDHFYFFGYSSDRRCPRSKL